jgi:preprotein translocase subunit SecD
MIRHPTPVPGFGLLIFGVVVAVWGCQRTSTAPTTAPTTAAVRSGFGLYLASDDPQDGYRAATVKVHPRTVYVAPTATMTSEDVAKVQLQADPQGRPQILIDFTAAGTRRFAEATRQNVHKQLAIVVDG